MERAMIISGENKGKSGEVIGMFYGAGICVIKTDDEKEYAAKLSEIKILYPIERRTVIGLPKEMVDEITKKCSIAFFTADITALKHILSDDNITASETILMFFACVISTLLSFIWRPIMCVAMFIILILKMFISLKPKRKHSKIRITHAPCKTCPCCGRELTYYNHGVYKDGICYEFCSCGYDSRREDEENTQMAIEIRLPKRFQFTLTYFSNSSTYDAYDEENTYRIDCDGIYITNIKKTDFLESVRDGNYKIINNNIPKSLLCRGYK